MSECSGCFNGCLEIHSDQCIKYTGLPVPELGIETNDSLSRVLELITDFLNDGEYAKYCNRMVPYEIVRYYGPLNNFTLGGSGIDKWENIYLCNGGNGTPNLTVGTTYYIMYKPA